MKTISISLFFIGLLTLSVRAQLHTFDDGKVFNPEHLAGRTDTTERVYEYNHSFSSAYLAQAENKNSEWFRSPADHKLLFLPSGKMQPARSFYYQNTALLFSTLSYGFGKNFSMSGTTALWPGLVGQVYLLTAKAGTTFGENLSVSGTFSIYSFGSLGGDNGFGTFFGNATYSWKRLDLTGGLGIAFTNQGSSEPVFIFAGQLRVFKNFVVISENMAVPNFTTKGQAVLSLVGARFIGRRYSLDLGFIANRDTAQSAPLISFMIKI